MFYYKIPVKRDNGEIIHNAFSGIYFCNSVCWLVYKKVVSDIKIVKESKCKKEPVCDKCLSKVFHLPVIYNHKATCDKVYGAIITNKQGEEMKQCSNCEVSNEFADCEVVIPIKEKIT